jgi:hypothetical protein
MEQPMQPQPTSVMLSAEAYRRELLADAARAQPVRPGRGVGTTSPIRLPRWRRTIGRALIWSGKRLLANDATA